MTKELSGLFMTPERWEAELAALQQPGPQWEGVHSLRLWAATPQHTASLLHVLGNSAGQGMVVRRLFLGDLEPTGAEALAAFLGSAAGAMLRSLTLQQLAGDATAAAAALAPGLLHAPHALAELTLLRCDEDAAVATLVAAAAGRGAQACMRPLQQLTLQRCRVGTAAAPALAALAAAGVLSLAVTSCHLTDASLQALASPLVPPSTFHARPCLLALQHLDLGSNALSTAGAACLARFLPQAPHLGSLVLANNPALSDAGITHVARGAALSPSLAHLDLSGCGVGVAGCAELARALRPRGSSDTAGVEAGCSCGGVLRELVLSNNPGIGAVGFAAVAAAAGAAGLRLLRMDACNVSGTALQALTSASPSDRGGVVGLHVLSLAGNANLGNEGVAWVARWLLGAAAAVAGSEAAAAAPLALQELDVSDAGVGDAGAQHLVQLLTFSPRLASLQCSRNAFHDLGAGRLCKAAAQHPALVRFKAEGGRFIDASSRARVADCMRLIAARASGAGSGVPTIPIPPRPVPSASSLGSGLDSARSSATGDAAAAGMGWACAGPLGAQVLQPSAPQAGGDLMARCSATGDAGAAAGGGALAAAAAKHSLERVSSCDGEHCHVAKHPHLEQQKASPAAAAARQGQSHQPSARVAVPVSKQRAFTGCSASSMRSSPSSSPSSHAHKQSSDGCWGAHSLAASAAVELTARHLGKDPDGPALVRPDRRASTSAAHERHVAPAVQPGRCSGSSITGTWSGYGYGRRSFRPLSAEQQALFADF